MLAQTMTATAVQSAIDDVDEKSMKFKSLFPSLFIDIMPQVFVKLNCLNVESYYHAAIY